MEKTLKTWMDGWIDHNHRGHWNIFIYFLKLPKASLDAMDLLKLTDGICGGVLVKDYAVTENGTMSENNNKNFITLKKSHKINMMRIKKAIFTIIKALFSMVKIPLGSVTLRCATASSRLNT